MNKLPSLSFRCGCLPARYKTKCQVLHVINMDDREIEIDGVVLKEKSVKKLIKFLEKSVSPMK